MSGRLSRRALTLSMTLLTLCSIVEKADENILPAVLIHMRKSYVECGVSSSVDIGLSNLGTITFVRAVFQAGISPWAGHWGDRYDRTVVVMIGCVVWGIAITCIGFSTSLWQATWLAALNGIGIALSIPTISSLVADMTGVKHRGRVFGIMGFMSNIGGMIGGAVATYVATKYECTGWRAVFISVGMLSVFIGVLEQAIAVDPHINLKEKTKGRHQEEIGGQLKQMIHSLFILARVPSCNLLVAQGIVGTMPWVSMSFFTVWFQTLGFSGEKAAQLVAIFSCSCAFGVVFGGFLGDNLSKRTSTGRILVGQTSILLGIGFSTMLCCHGIRYTPSHPDDGFSSYAMMLALLGLSSSWCGTNNTVIFSEIVPQHMLTRVFAFDRTFEGAIGALGAPLVGIVASRWFGFSFQGEEPGKALSKALLFCLLCPWTLCLIFYSCLHRTYAEDKRRAREQMPQSSMDVLVAW